MPAPRRTTHRHGDLRNALVSAAVDLARAGGPSAVVLREATRRAGVAPNAAYRHFADRDDLLHAVAAVGMAELAVALEAEMARVPAGLDAAARARARMRAAGVGYLRYALAEPGLFRAAFTTGQDEPGPADGPTGSQQVAGAGGATPSQQLGAALDDLVSAGAVPAEHRPGADLVAWAAVHGLAVLLIDGRLRHLGPDQADRVGDQLVAVVVAGLCAPSVPPPPSGD